MNASSPVMQSTKYRDMDDLASLPGVASRPVARKAAAEKQPEVVQWASRMMATLLLARAAAASGSSLAVPPPPQPTATPPAAEPLAVTPAPAPMVRAAAAAEAPVVPQMAAADDAAPQLANAAMVEPGAAVPAAMPGVIGLPAVAGVEAASVANAPAADVTGTGTHDVACNAVPPV